LWRAEAATGGCALPGRHHRLAKGLYTVDSHALDLPTLTVGVSPTQQRASVHPARQRPPPLQYSEYPRSFRCTSAGGTADPTAAGTIGAGYLPSRAQCWVSDVRAQVVESSYVSIGRTLDGVDVGPLERGNFGVKDPNS
jgi:hypothetical protein